MKRSWLFRGVLGLLMGALTVMLMASLASPGASAQDDDPVAAVENLVSAANTSLATGDGAAFAAAFTENGFFNDINGGSFAIVGRTAMTAAFSGEPDPDFQITLIGATADGNTVNGVLEVIDATSVEAGVDRVIQPFVAVVEDGLVASMVVTYDASDPQTATYLEYQATLEEEEGDDFPPGAVTIDLDGDQPGQMFVGEFDGIPFVAINIAPGGEGVHQPVHIHTGTCDEPGPVVYPLASVSEGSSITLLSAPLSELLGSDYIVNVHLSPEQADVYVSCGVLAEPSDIALPDTGTGASSNSPLVWLVAALALAGATMALGAWRLRIRA